MVMLASADRTRGVTVWVAVAVCPWLAVTVSPTA
jgi:hypothetical protein